MTPAKVFRNTKSSRERGGDPRARRRPCTCAAATTAEQWRRPIVVNRGQLDLGGFGVMRLHGIALLPEQPSRSPRKAGAAPGCWRPVWTIKDEQARRRSRAKPSRSGRDERMPPLTSVLASIAATRVVRARHGPANLF